MARTRGRALEALVRPLVVMLDPEGVERALLCTERGPRRLHRARLSTRSGCWPATKYANTTSSGRHPPGMGAARRHGQRLADGKHSSSRWEGTRC